MHLLFFCKSLTTAISGPYMHCSGFYRIFHKIMSVHRYSPSASKLEEVSMDYQYSDAAALMLHWKIQYLCYSGRWDLTFFSFTPLWTHGKLKFYSSCVFFSGYGVSMIGTIKKTILLGLKFKNSGAKTTHVEICIICYRNKITN